MTKIKVYYDESTEEIFTEDELLEVMDDKIFRSELHIDILKTDYSRYELWEMLKPEVQQEILSEAREIYIEDNCLVREIEV